MAITNISTSYTPPAYQTQPTSKTSLDKDGFLRMLTEQIKNQDPGSNQDPTQYFNTISQMTIVEQLTNLAQGSAVTSAQGMLGRTVSYNSADGSPTSGLVTGVSIASGKPTLTVGTASGISPSAITAIA